MSFPCLSRLAQQAHLRIVLLDAGCGMSLSLAGLAQPLQLAATLLPRGRLQIEIGSASALPASAAPDIALLVGPDTAPAYAAPAGALEYLRRASSWGGVGSAVLWLVRAGAMDGARVALPWALYPEAAAGERAILTSHLFEIDDARLSCCGGAASIDFSLTLIESLFGADIQAQVKENLCIERVRGAGDRQRIALQARFGGLQPKLSEAVALMEANIEEPLGADDIASLVGISRRQLERQFKQYLGSVPSRYYLELRLQRARTLLLESHHSIVQVGLICGFSSGPHFSTAYRALFDITPREERQKKLTPGR
jgi:transcriptional regulator GlxA family with amidase domain